MKTDIKLRFIVDENYAERVKQFSEHSEFSSFRYEFDVTNAKSKAVTVTFRKNRFFLNCDLKTGTLEREREYNHILNCLEFSDGILLLLTKSRFLFIPLMNDTEYCKNLYEILCLLGKESEREFRMIEPLQSCGIYTPAKVKWRCRQFWGKNMFHLNFFNILIIIVSLFLGTMFFIDTFNYRTVEKSEAISVDFTFEVYEINYTFGKRYFRSLRRNKCTLYSTDNQEVKIYTHCLNGEVIEKLNTFEKGDKLEILLHPYNNYIIELIHNGKEVINFDDSQKRIQIVEGACAVFLILLLYGVSIGDIYFTVKEYKKIRNLKRSRKDQWLNG